MRDAPPPPLPRGRGSSRGRPRGCEQSGWRRAEDLLKIATLWEGWGAEVGGRLRGRAGSRAAAEAGRGRVRREAGPAARARTPAPETREARVRESEGCGFTWACGRGAGKDARGTGGAREPPEVERRGAWGWTGDCSPGKDGAPEISEAKHAHAKRKVLVGRPGLALLLQGPWAARGRAEDRAGKEPAAQVRAASAAPRIRGSATSFLREESVVGRYLERPHSCLDFRGSFKGIFHLGF